MTDETGAQLTKAQQIAAELKAAIERGDYGPGDRLPGENALATQYSVASLTARRALKLLRTEGLVETKKGAGARVISFHPIRRRGIQRLARGQWGAGKRFGRPTTTALRTSTRSRCRKTSPRLNTSVTFSS